MNEPALICLCYSGFVFSWICGLCFSDLCYSAFSYLCFPSSFPNIRKYFPENFLKCNQTPWKHFPFLEISISGKYVFSGKRFTTTKHSLREKRGQSLVKVGQTRSNSIDGPETTRLCEIHIRILIIGIEKYGDILVLVKFENNWLVEKREHCHKGTQQKSIICHPYIWNVTIGFKECNQRLIPVNYYHNQTVGFRERRGQSLAQVGQTRSNLIDNPETTRIFEIHIQILIIGIEKYGDILVLVKFENNWLVERIEHCHKGTQHKYLMRHPYIWNLTIGFKECNERKILVTYDHIQKVGFREWRGQNLVKVGQIRSNLINGPKTTRLCEIHIRILIIGIEKYGDKLVLVKFEKNWMIKLGKHSHKGT